MQTTDSNQPSVNAAAVDDRLVDTAYVCKTLGISERLAIQMRQAGKGPQWLRVGLGRSRGHVRYPLRALTAWIAEQCRRPEHAA